jgi:parallel beta-helix repeat protein
MTTHLVQQVDAEGLLRSRNGIALNTIAPTSNPIAAEAGAAAHWIFGSDNPNRADLVAASQMRRNLFAAVTAGGSGYSTAPSVTVSSGDATFACTVSGGAVTSIVCTDVGTTVYTTAPTLTLTGGGGTGATASVTLGNAPFTERNFIKLNAADHITYNGRNGLLSRIADASNQTMWAVARRQPVLAAQPPILFGNNLSGSGQGISLQSSNVFRSNVISNMSMLDEPDTGWAGAQIGYNWFFIATSVIGTPTANGNKCFIGGIASPFYQQTAGKTVTTRRIGIGNCYGLATQDESWDFAEFGVINSALADQAALAALYGRAKARMALRGISVL